MQRGETGIAPPTRKSLTVRQLAEKFKAEAQRDVWNLDDYRGAFWSDYSQNADAYIGKRATVEVTRVRTSRRGGTA